MTRDERATAFLAAMLGNSTLVAGTPNWNGIGLNDVWEGDAGKLIAESYRLAEDHIAHGLRTELLPETRRVSHRKTLATNTPPPCRSGRWL